MTYFTPNSFQVANAFVDELFSKISGNAVKCYILIVRKTKGWNKHADAISMSQFKEFCGICDDKTVRRALDELIEQSLIGKRTINGKANVYFLLDAHQKTEPPPLPENGTPPLPKFDTHNKQANTKTTSTTRARETVCIFTHEGDSKNCINNHENCSCSKNQNHRKYEKFAMTTNWAPDMDSLAQRMRMAGKPMPDAQALREKLAEFVSYWIAEGSEETGLAWNHKFFKCLLSRFVVEQSVRRGMMNAKPKREAPKLLQPDETLPVIVDKSEFFKDRPQFDETAPVIVDKSEFFKND